MELLSTKIQYQNTVSRSEGTSALSLSEPIPASGAGAELVDTELPVMVGMPFRGFAGRQKYWDEGWGRTD